MNLALRKIKALPAPLPASKGIRRVFNNDQLIERFEKWLLICGKSQNTRINYTTSVRQFGEFFDKPLTAATKEDVKAFIATLYGKGKAPATIQARLDSLRVFFDFLTLGSQVRASVARFVTRRKLPQRLPPAKSEAEIERLISVARRPRDRAILELAYASGLRLAELANLRVEDVDLNAGSLIVRQGKGGDDRIALFGRAAADALAEYLGERKSGAVFRSQPKQQHGGVTRGKGGDWWGLWRERDDNGKLVQRCIRLGDYEIRTREQAREALHQFLASRGVQTNRKAGESLTPRSIGRIVESIAKRAGIEGVHPHIFRHSMATHCLNRGMDIRHVQELLGHTSLVATQKYLHVASQRLQDTHAKFHPHGERDES
jgi:site-specific recombinase XerD